jgi:conjugative relaxase-like TrwC/TraI family protein
MLTISKPLSTAQAHSYHQREFASAEQSYYSQGEAVRGEWQGKLAAGWGLTGQVSAEQFHRLAEGQDPRTGEQLVRHRFPTAYENGEGKTVRSAGHRAGWDATFSAPKSVSITALVGRDDRVREAHRESVRVALDELERYVQARIGGNHPAETTGSMIAARFEHDSARPVNGYSAPQLHTHAVIFNVTQTSDGKPHALQPHDLYRMQQYATAVYRSELASRLRQLGYELERGKEGAFEIKGYTPEYLAASSPRRQQIKDYLEAAGLKGAEAAEIGAHRTRQAKQHVSPHELEKINLAVAAQYGNDPRKVVAQAHGRRRRHRQNTGDPLAVANAALTYARDRNIEREAVVDERILLRDALKRALGEAGPQEVRSALSARISKGEFIEVHRDSRPESARQLTTRTMLDYERQNLALMQAGRGLGEPLVHRDVLRVTKAELQHLNPAQAQAVTEILASTDRITGFQGVAGSGKTTILDVVRRAAENEGYIVEGFAPTSRAAHKLEIAGISSTTLQSFLVRAREEENETKHVYVLDESSLASTRQVNEFLRRLGERDRVLLVGDVRQHQAVEAGRPFQQLQEAGMKTARLEDVVRQQNPDLKRAVKLLAEGNIGEAFDHLKQQGRVHEMQGAQRRLEAIASEYLKAPEQTLVVAPDNRSRLQINQIVRAGLQASGAVNPDEHRVAVLVSRNDLTGADRAWAAKYEPGDVVRYTRGSSVLGFKAGEYATVSQVDSRSNLLTVRTQEGREVAYDPERLQGVNVYRPEERQFAAGERIQFTAPFKQQRVANRELGQIEAMDSRGNLRVRLESDRTIEFNLRDHPHLDYGYAMTSYSSQGQTADRLLVHISGEAVNPDLVNRRFAYVAVSRARQDVQIYTDNATTLTDKLNRDVSKKAVIETAVVPPKITDRPREHTPVPMEQSLA